MKKTLQALKKYSNQIFIFIVIFITLFVCCFLYYKSTHSIERDFSSIDLDGVNNLMIVAHPDDEMLWGGAHLIRDNYLVVCITCGNVKIRVYEFVSVMNETHDKYIMLGYPDKTNGERDNWDNWRSSISDDLRKIINLKDWDVIVTHNPDGEYGHQHHKMTSRMVTSIAKNKNLYYFGKYHSKKTIKDYYEEMAPISDKYLSEKKRIIGIYGSQRFIQTTFDHMYPYEDWVLASEWSAE